jgi:hypothetical protein
MNQPEPDKGAEALHLDQRARDSGPDDGLARDESYQVWRRGWASVLKTMFWKSRVASGAKRR